MFHPRFIILRLGLAASTLLFCGSAIVRGEGAATVTFRQDVMAVLSKAGCNAGGCHGNGNGKGGFRLSLRGQDPELDWLALTRDQGGRRINLLDPEKSLIILKASAALAHEGGKRFAPGSVEYETLLAWLKEGAPDSGTDAPKLTQLEVTPAERVLIEPERDVRLHARARFADGSERDVTRLAVYEPTNLATTISPEGTVTGSEGETTILVRYLDQQVAVRLAFVPARPDFVWEEPPANNFIDEQVFAKLRVLRINPSALSSDAVFVRRAYLDLLGVVPSAETARRFVEDRAPEKRSELIERLLTRPEFADFWALKWADLLKIEERVLDPQGMRVFHGWIRESIAANKALDQFARELVAARGSTYQNPPANWWRANRDPITRAENTARVLFGTQLNCAQCHNHPFERWTQDDYYNWAGLFARVDYKIIENKRKDKNDQQEFKGDQIVLLKSKGVVLNPRNGEPARPRFLGGETPVTTAERDELLALADWLTETPMFARMQVNRVWFHLFGRGLVEPVDDFRASNPPTHPALLDALAKDFAAHGYDLRHLIRRITSSRVYQLASEPNATNVAAETNHSRAIVQRLTAEQLLDSMSKVTGAPLQIDDFPAGTRLAQIPEGRKHYRPLRTDLDRFAAAFGKPPRLIASDCERSNETALGQVFQLISGPVIQELLTRRGNRIDALVSATEDNAILVDEIFWSALSRPPTALETERSSKLIQAAADRRKGCEDLLWALLNSKEFVFRR